MKYIHKSVLTKYKRNSKMSKDFKKDYWRQSRRSMREMSIKRTISSIVFLVFIVFGSAWVYNEVKDVGLKTIVHNVWNGEDNSGEQEDY